MKTNIEIIAAALDAAVIYDRAGDIALQARIYDELGVQQVRHRPDPCDFRPREQWLAMTSNEASSHVC